MEQTSRENKRAKKPSVPLVRLNVNLNNETADALRELADERGVSVTEVVRRAISLYKYIEDETHDGRRIQVADRSGKTVSELVLI